jgi:hypothetical protein
LIAIVLDGIALIGSSVMGPHVIAITLALAIVVS